VGSASCCTRARIRECPKCHKGVVSDTLDELMEMEERAAELGEKIQKAILEENPKQAQEMLGELIELNEALSIEGIEEFIEYAKKEVKERILTP
jgi:hypothetical protein